jgi:type VI secretion system protein ImpA
MTPNEKLLEPLPGPNPCGEDLWAAEGHFQFYAPMNQALQNGEEPKWQELLDGADELIQRSRDLRIAMVLCLARFRIEGLGGLRDGLALIDGLTARYWEHVHPLPDGADDPTRVNVLGSLSMPMGSNTPYQFVKYLRRVPLCQSAAGTAYTLADLENADAGQPAGGDADKPVATSDQIRAALRAMKEEPRQAILATLAAIKSHLDAIKQVSGANFEALETVLKSMDFELQGEKKPQEIVPAGETKPGAPVGSVPLGQIASRADALRALGAVGDYFRRAEPSSPVPLLLDRARRWIEMDFMENIRDLAPDALERIHLILGTKEPQKPDGG